MLSYTKNKIELSQGNSKLQEKNTAANFCTKFSKTQREATSVRASVAHGAGQYRRYAEHVAMLPPLDRRLIFLVHVVASTVSMGR